MAKDKEKKSSHFSLSGILHIKKHTVSTSNEISLSVLDARKQASEERTPTDSTTKIGRVSLFTLNSNKPYVPTPKSLLHSGFGLGSSPRSDSDKTAKANKSAKSTKSAKPAKPAKSGKSTKAAKGAKAAKNNTAPIATMAAAKKRAEALPDPEAEIKRRKARRKLRRVIGTTAACCAAIAVLTVGGLYISQEYQARQEMLADLDRSVALISDADVVVVAVDELVAEPLTDESVVTAEELLGQTGEAIDEVESASKLAKKVYSHIKITSDKEAARQAYMAAEARKTMLSSGNIIIATNIDYYYASAEMTKMWRTIHQADALTEEAAALVSKTTAENTRASAEKTDKALGLFQKARGEVDGVAVMIPSADLAAIADYLDIRIGAMGHALASDDAIYIQDKKTAERENDQYNQMEAKAAEIAAGFSKDPLGPLLDARDAEIADLVAEYDAARDKATDTDAFLRDYLGTEK